MEYITSKSNEKIKYIKSLNEKKYRQKYGEYYLEGIKVVSEAIDMYIKKAVDIKFIAYSYDILNKLNGSEKLLKKISDLNKNNGIVVLNIAKDIFEYVVDTVTTQGILVVVKKDEDIQNFDISKKIKDSSKNILILDSLQDQGNIGTIIRTANAFDIENIICTSSTADAYSPKTLRSTMGSIFKVKLSYLDNEKIKKAISDLKSNGYKIIGTSLNSKKFIDELDFSKKYAFVVGNEANGISDYISSLCDENIKIPMNENIDSLNVGVATGILLYKQYIK